jgi:hypothetical protein
MVTATIKANMARSRTDATTKLDYWSRILHSEFHTTTNRNGNYPLIPNMGISDQLAAKTEKIF